VTDNLNFGNPYKPEIFWQLREAVEGAAEACRAFGTPVIGGNVSLYNESPAGAVDPTPTIAMVGLIEEERHITTQFFKKSGDVIILVGEVGDDLGASHFLKVCHGRKEGLPPRLNIELELAAQNAVRELIRAGLIKSAHDCSEGGLAVALAESCFDPERLLGAHIDLGATESRVDQVLFNEAQSRIIISVAKDDENAALTLLKKRGVSATTIGVVVSEDIRVSVKDQVLRWPIATLFDDWYFAIERVVSQI